MTPEPEIIQQKRNGPRPADYEDGGHHKVVKLQQYYSAAASDNSDLDSGFQDQDSRSLELLDAIAPFEESDLDAVPQENYERSAEYSDFFVEAYSECFPDALAKEMADFFRFLVHPYRRCFDSPVKSPKNEEIESAIRNKGQKGCCTFMRETGKFIVRPLDDWMFSGDMLFRKHYYTSDNRVALPYFDVDTHLDYQTDADAAAARSMIEKEMAARLGIAPKFLESGRGRNGYLKVDLAGVAPDEANRVFDELQDAIKLLIAKHGIMVDFEIKGTITWRDQDGTLHAGRYGKLPMCAPDWDYNWHRSLVKAKRVTIADLKKLVAGVKAEVTEKDISRHDAAKRKAFLDHYLPVDKTHQWKLAAEFGFARVEDEIVKFDGQQWIARVFVGEKLTNKWWPDYEPEVPAAPTAAVALEDNGAASPPGSTTSFKKTVQDDADLGDEPDALVRQRKALLQFARLLKRVPSVEEALKYIQHNGLYSGAWRNPARKTRVRGILKYIAKTFDRAKCTKPGRSPLAVNIGKYDAWAKAKFPVGFVGVKKRKIVTDEFEVLEVHERIEIGWEFISIFVSVCEYCLLLDGRPDGSLPHERAKKLWSYLFNKKMVLVNFDDRKWAACRDGLTGIVKVTDRNYSAGKAMRWAIDQFFPFLGLWKKNKLPSLLEAVDRQEFVDSLFITRERRHNSLLNKKPSDSTETGILPDPHPPPAIESG